MKKIDFENGTVTGNILSGGTSYACCPDVKSFI